MKVPKVWTMYVVARAHDEHEREYWADDAGVQRWVIAPRCAYLFESKIAADMRARREIGARVFHVDLRVAAK